MTICWHVDDLKMSHRSPQVAAGKIEWLRGIYGNLQISGGKKHEYLGMDIDYTTEGKVTFSIEKYTRNVIAEFPKTWDKTPKQPPVNTSSPSTTTQYGAP